MRFSSASHVLLLLGSVVATTATADFEDAFTTPRQAAQANERTVGVQFERNALFFDLMEDIESSLELAAGMRIVPIVAKNHVQSVYDLLYLDGVDLALVRSDSIEYVRRVAGVAGAQRLTQNVARIGNEKIVIIAGEAYTGLDELEGKAIGFGGPGSGEFVTGTLLFDSIGIPVQEVEAAEEEALEKVRSGELAAMVHLLDSPGGLVSRSDVLTDNVVVLPLPENDNLAKLYHQTSLDANDLPGLIAENVQPISTYSVDVNLVAYEWNSQNERTRRIGRFVEALVDRLEELQGDAFQPEWREVSLEAVTPNISRSPMVKQAIAQREAAIAQWLEKRHGRQAEAAVQAATVEQVFDDFNTFLRQPERDNMPVVIDDATGEERGFSLPVVSEPGSPGADS